MKFDEFWTLIRERSSFILETPVRKKKFTVTYNSQYDLVEIKPSTTNVRTIQKSHFQKIWNIARKSVNPSEAKQYHKTTFQSSYIVSIMRHIVSDGKIE